MWRIDRTRCDRPFRGCGIRHATHGLRLGLRGPCIMVISVH
ncbi:hypothetical protein CDAR_382931, partial [Caerostris darwini]